MRIGATLIALALCCATAVAASNGQDDGTIPAQNPLGQHPAAVQAGKARFESACAICHGVKGEGGRGSKLASSSYLREMTDRQIFEVVRHGVSGTEMMAFSFSDRENWELVAFIRSLNASAIEQTVPGDVAAGRSVFFGEGNCSSCHAIAGQGGVVGPDLSNIGAEQPIETISESIRHPSAQIAPRYRQAQLTTLDGHVVKGVVKNDSTYSIQIMDLSGDFRFYSKSELRRIVYSKESLMPAVHLSGKDLQNLLAFLSRQSLKGTFKAPAGANRVYR